MSFIKKYKNYLVIGIITLFLYIITSTYRNYAGEPPIFEYLSEIAAESHVFSVDYLSNIYWIEDGGLIKLKPDDKTIFHYSNKSWGEIHSFDVSDPLHILVLFKDFNKVVFLDKNLIPKDLPVNQVLIDDIRPSLVCSSSQNGFWAFSPLNYKLYHINDKFKVEIESESINHLYPEFSDPYHMKETDNKIFISDQNSGIWVFDKFAEFLFLVPLKNITFFQVRDNSILYFYDDQIGLYDFEHHIEEFFLLPEEHVIKGYIHDLTLYLLKEGVIKKYRIK